MPGTSASACTSVGPVVYTGRVDGKSLLVEGPQGLGFASRDLQKGSLLDISGEKGGLHRAITMGLRGFDGFGPFLPLKVLARLLTPDP